MSRIDWEISEVVEVFERLVETEINVKYGSEEGKVQSLMCPMGTALAAQLTIAVFLKRISTS